MPQPVAPKPAGARRPNGVGSSRPNTSSAVSGTFTTSAPTCNAITAFGRETAMLNER